MSCIACGQQYIPKIALFIFYESIIIFLDCIYYHYNFIEFNLKSKGFEIFAHLPNIEEKIGLF